MKYYDIELIDISDSVENQKFSKISKEDLLKIINIFKSNKSFIEFKSLEADVVLKTKFYRGIMWADYIEKAKSTTQETMENAVLVSGGHNDI